MKVKIGVIVGTTRPGRMGRKVAEWYVEQVKDVDGIEFELVDIADMNLPLFDEPNVPAANDYQHEHTKNWSKVVSGYDGYVWVSAEYNHAPPSSLTNAISFLFHEWAKKPVALLTYGSIGGARAAEHLRTIAGELQMADIRSQIMIRSPRRFFEEEGNVNEDFLHGDPTAQAEELKWWAGTLRTGRA